MKIINVMASSLDGRIAVQDAESDEQRQAVGLSGDADQEFLREQIQAADAVIVGARSVRANGGCFEAGDGSPHWYVIGRSSIPGEMNFWRQTHLGRTIVSPHPLSMPAGNHGVTNLCPAGKSLPVWLRDHLESRGFETVLLLGGGVINRMFYNAGVVDGLRLTLSPIIVGRSRAPHLVEPGLPRPVSLVLKSSLKTENFVFLDYEILHQR